jgi:hypothetical protein
LAQEEQLVEKFPALGKSRSKVPRPQLINITTETMARLAEMPKALKSGVGCEKWSLKSGVGPNAVKLSDKWLF